MKNNEGWKKEYEIKYILRGIRSWLIYKSSVLQERNGKTELEEKGKSVSSHEKQGKTSVELG